MPKQVAHGRFVWHDLTTSDPNAAAAFYTQVASWQTQKWDDSTDYTLFVNATRRVGGVAEDKSTHPNWMPFVSVYDVDACVRQAGSLGGAVRVPPKEGQSIGGMPLLPRPRGAALGLFR